MLVHKGLIPAMKLWKQKSSPVLNLQAKLSTVVDNLEIGHAVKNLDGHTAAVVHQYDRNDILQKRLFQRYVYWIDTSDPMVEWKETEHCKNFTIVPNQDLFKGKCDLMNQGGATGPSTCCSLCLATQACRAFSFAMGHTCFFKDCGLSEKERMKLDDKKSVMKGAYSAYL